MRIHRADKQPQSPQQGRRRPSGSTDDANRQQAFSYYSRRSADDSQFNRRESISTEADSERTSILRPNLRATVGAAICFILVLILSYTSTTPRIVLSAANQKGFLQPTDIYAASANQALASSLLNHNKLTLDSAAVRLKLLKDYPELHDVAVRTPLFGTQPVITVQAYQPALILTASGGAAYVIDEAGRVIAPTNQFAHLSDLQLPTVQTTSDISIQAGSRALPSTTVDFIRTLESALSARKMSVNHYTLPASTYELDIYPVDAGYFVKFNLEDDALEQAGTFLAVANRFNTSHNQPGKYIDVRVPERAYYQ